MKILMLSAEAAPFARVGGLSQVVYFLSKHLASQNDVRVFMPKYGIVKKNFIDKKILISGLKIPFGQLNQRPVICNIKTCRQTKTRPLTYFLENREYYELRANVFAYSDDHLRFLLLSRGCLEWLLYQKKTKGWLPDIIHCHDWHTGYFVDELRRNNRYSSLFKNIPVLYTVHNFKYQGNLGFKNLPPSQRDNAQKKIDDTDPKKLLLQNPLLRGLLFADWVNTVSQNHVLEVTTSEYGEGLEEYTQKIKGKFSGILNGLDHQEFNPSTDPFLISNYSVTSLGKRAANKLDVQRIFGLNQDQKPMLLGFVGRLSKQKGLDILLAALSKFLQEFSCQFVFLGDGDGEYKHQLAKLAQQFPHQVSNHLYPDFKLPRKIFAGCDAILMPSVFEPGGIVALEAMRYGAVPIARLTGGLADSVHDFNPGAKEGNGFTFKKLSAWSLFATMVRAREIYHQAPLWKKLMTNAMRSDFSWGETSLHYSQLYSKVIRQRKRFLESNPHQAYQPLIRT